MDRESKSTLESQSQNHNKKRRMHVPQTIASGDFDREFDFDSQEWICSYATVNLTLTLKSGVALMRP